MVNNHEGLHPSSCHTLGPLPLPWVSSLVSAAAGSGSRSEKRNKCDDTEHDRSWRIVNSPSHGGDLLHL